MVTVECLYCKPWCGKRHGRTKGGGYITYHKSMCAIQYWYHIYIDAPKRIAFQWIYCKGVLPQVGVNPKFSGVPSLKTKERSTYIQINAM